jgi:hypothetical protein
VLVAAPGLIGQLLHALTDALMGQAVGLPMLFAALLVLGRYRARHPSGHAGLGSGRAGLARTVYIAVAVGTLGYFVVPPSGMALASSTSPASAAITAGVNPCTTAPHDTFNVSAINVTMTLNRYGVNDPRAGGHPLLARLRTATAPRSRSCSCSCCTSCT